MKLTFVQNHQGGHQINCLFYVMNVSTLNYRAYRTRLVRHSQRWAMVPLGHIEEQFTLSHSIYGRVRMIVELKELGLHVGHRASRKIAA